LVSLVGCDRTINAHGIVADESSGEPIPEAKVLLTVWDEGVWDANPRIRKGVRTDASGRFHITAEPDFDVGQVHLEIVTPGNSYVFIEDHEPGSTIALPYKCEAPDDKQCKHYATFSGKWSGDVQWDSEPTQSTNDRETGEEAGTQ